jgi:hypothetical protein
VPIEIRRTVFPPNRAALAERTLDLIDGPVRGRFRIMVRTLLGFAYCAAGSHQTAYVVGSSRFAETRIRHAPQPAANDEIAAVRRHRMLHYH